MGRQLAGSAYALRAESASEKTATDGKLGAGGSRAVEDKGPTEGGRFWEKDACGDRDMRGQGGQA